MCKGCGFWRSCGATPIHLRRSLLGVIAFVFLLALSNESVQAQVLFGSLVGNVTDASGAAVPSASVKITETTTNNVFNVQTNDSGTYTVPNVPAGTYQVEVSKEGFRTFVTTNIVVNQNNEVRVDASMQVGAQVEKVEVTAQAAALQTDRADLHSEVATQQLENLPQANRTYEGLFELVPGSTPPNGQLQGGTNNPSKSMSFSMNGSGVSGPNVRIEGVSARNPWVTNYTTFVPSVEAIQDVNIVTNAAEAEQGIADGASVNVRLKSGSNGFHGAGFEYNIGAYSEANNFFNNQIAGSKPPHLVDNDTGGNAGGPIIRDKLFYFGSYEGDYNDSAVSGILSLPTATELSGNESASPNPIYNPTTGNQTTGTGRTPFAGNIVPASMFDPVVVKLLPHFPAVTYPNLPINNDFVNQAQVYNLHKIDTKIDYTATQKLRFSGRYGYQPFYNVQQPIYGQFLGGSGGFASAGAGNYLQHGATLAVSGSATYIVNPTFVVDATFGVTQAHQLLFPTNANERQGQELGIPGANTGPLPWAGGLPNFAIANFVTFGYSYPALEYKDPIFEYQANGTKTAGAHTIRFGFDIIREHQNHIEVRNTIFTFSGNATALNGGPSPNEWNAMADFLLGDSTTLGNYVQFVYPLTLRTWDLAFYGQDQWQVNRKLTLNFGLRWEHYPVPTQANRGINYYDPQTDIIEECGVDGVSGNCGIRVSNKIFAPSIGLAYRLFENFVIRAGYSLEPQPDSMGRSGVQSYPDEAQSTLNGATSYAVAGTPSTTGAPVIPQPVLVQGATLVPPNTGNLFWNPANFIRGYIQSYNFTLQKEFKGGYTTQVAYVGSHGVHLFTNENINYGQVGGGAASQPLDVYGITASSTENLPVLSDKYNSLQASVRKALSAGLHLQGAFTYQHDIGIQTLSILIPQYFNRNDYTTAIDRTFNVSFSADYELPFGKGRQFVKNGFVSYIVGGWNINGIFTHFSGLPFTVTSSSAACNCPGNTVTANQILPTVAFVGNGITGQPYFNPLAYAPVTTAALGTSGFDQLRGPGATNLDASVFRDFSVTERIKIQLRVEALNATNTPHFANPSNLNASNLKVNSNGTYNLNGFDQITGTAQISRLVDPRYLRLGVRISF